MEQIKPVCGFKDSKRQFHEYEWQAELANQRYNLEKLRCIALDSIEYSVPHSYRWVLENLLEYLATKGVNKYLVDYLEAAAELKEFEQSLKPNSPAKLIERWWRKLFKNKTTK